MLLFPLHGYVDFVSAEHRKGISPALSDHRTPWAYAECGWVVVIRRGTYTAGEEGGGRYTPEGVRWGWSSYVGGRRLVRGGRGWSLYVLPGARRPHACC